MRVFVAGATGAIGRPLVPMLLAAGHEVTGMTRSPERAQRLRATGAEAVVCDAYDAAAVRAAVAAARPEVIVHELTDIPQAIDVRRYARQFEDNDRLRIVGTHNLLDAGLLAGVRRVVAQSVAFAYRPEGDMVKDEDAPLYTDGPGALARLVGSVAELERMVSTTPSIEGLVLRYGYFYGPGTAYAASDGHVANEVRRRRMPVVGRGEGVFSFVHVEDAARATAIAVERGAPGVYNVVDDEPAPVREWLPVYAAALGAPPPRRVPAWLARVLAGQFAVYGMTRLRGAANARARAELGWAPVHASWREGFREAAG